MCASLILVMLLYSWREGGVVNNLNTLVHTTRSEIDAYAINLERNGKNMYHSFPYKVKKNTS